MFFFLMIRRPPRSTLDRSSAASDVYKRQVKYDLKGKIFHLIFIAYLVLVIDATPYFLSTLYPVSYTHLRAHETVLDLVCRLLLEKKKILKALIDFYIPTYT